VSTFSNVYEDDTRASAYARLEFPGTYYLAYRDIPGLVRQHVRGTRALDFGCGAGRSTRFLRNLGFDAVGVDVSPQMIAQARAIDPSGDYRLVADGDLGELPPGTFDLVLCAFTFDNVPTIERKVLLFTTLARMLRPGGHVVNLVSSPDIYLHEWASFSTKDFPANRDARSGDRVRIVMLDVDDARPVDDILCSDEDYREIYRRAGLGVITLHRPLGDASEPWPWKSETTIPPWSIYVLGSS
jgi:SAM-dependent methyltransferase